MARDLFATLDLNLLKTLSVLAQENNMRRAAERLYVTQPAVSQALKKLRHHFGDELFIKTPTGLQPTSFTNSLMERVEPILDELSSTLNEGEAFDPALIDRPLRVVMAPHMGHFLSAGLCRAIRSGAPDAEIYFDNWSSHSLADIAKGEFLLGISVPLGSVPGEIASQELADDYFRMYVREDHPVFGKKDIVTLAELDGAEIAALIIPDFNARVAHIERIMKSNGLEARVGFRSAVPSAVAGVVRSSDMIYGASSYIDPRELDGLRAIKVKVGEQFMNYPVSAYFHRKNNKSPLLAWLLGLISDLLENGSESQQLHS